MISSDPGRDLGRFLVAMLVPFSAGLVRDIGIGKKNRGDIGIDKKSGLGFCHKVYA